MALSGLQAVVEVGMICPECRRSLPHSEARSAVLRVLGREPMTSRDIAELVGFSQQAVRWALNGLLALGVVERSKIQGHGTRGSYGWVKQ